MSLQATACPDDLALLTKALDDRCRELGLAYGDSGREQLARRVMYLFETGTLSVDDLTRELSQARLEQEPRGRAQAAQRVGQFERR